MKSPFRKRNLVSVLSTVRSRCLPGGQVVTVNAWDGVFDLELREEDSWRHEAEAPLQQGLRVHSSSNRSRRPPVDTFSRLHGGNRHQMSLENSENTRLLVYKVSFSPGIPSKLRSTGNYFRRNPATMALENHTFYYLRSTSGLFKHGGR